MPAKIEITDQTALLVCPKVDKPGAEAEQEGGQHYVLVISCKHISHEMPPVIHKREEIDKKMGEGGKKYKNRVRFVRKICWNSLPYTTTMG